MEKTPALMRQATSALQDVQNREEMVALIDGLSHYMGKVQFLASLEYPLYGDLFCLRLGQSREITGKLHAYLKSTFTAEAPRTQRG